MTNSQLDSTTSPLTTKAHGVWARLLGYLAPYRGTFILALLCMVGYGATDGVVPFLVKHVLDGVFAAQNKGLLYALPAIIIVFAIVRALLDFWQQFLMSKVGHLIVKDIRTRLHDHLLKLSPDFFVANSSAKLVSSVTSDVVLVRTLLTEALASVIRDVIRVVALVSAALYLDVTLALIALIAFPIGVIPVYRFGRRMRRLSRVGQEAIGNLSSILQETALGNRVVKIFGKERYEAERFAGENERLTSTFLRAEKVRALGGPVNEVLASIAISGVLLYGGFSVIGGIRSQGDFIAFLLAVFLMYDPFKKLSRVNSVVQQGLAGSERIFRVLDSVPSVREPEAPLPLPKEYDITFENVSYSYKGVAGDLSEHIALTGINLEIKAGQKVALVGFSGAGKSTLVDLIPRFMDPQQGIVRLGGIDIARLKIADLRSKIAMVGQHTFLFHDTVLSNIAYGSETLNEHRIFEAAKAAFAYDFISRLPRGFHTVLGESGMTLSGGERQRLAIARAILKNAPILILDEATASLDNQSEREVQAALEALEKGRTTIVIAHRLSTVRSADLIIVLKDGRIVEQGTHDELLKGGGEFAKLHALQFQEANTEPGVLAIN